MIKVQTTTSYIVLFRFRYHCIVFVFLGATVALTFHCTELVLQYPGVAAPWPFRPRGLSVRDSRLVYTNPLLTPLIRSNAITYPHHVIVIRSNKLLDETGWWIDSWWLGELRYQSRAPLFSLSSLSPPTFHPAYSRAGFVIKSVMRIDKTLLSYCSMGEKNCQSSHWVRTSARHRYQSSAIDARS